MEAKARISSLDLNLEKERENTKFGSKMKLGLVMILIRFCRNSYQECEKKKLEEYVSAHNRTAQILKNHALGHTHVLHA